MKAKEYAAILLEAQTPEAYEDTLFAFLDELVLATISAMKKRANGNSALACVRETFTKWKAIVVQVKDGNPNCIIDEALFPKYFSYASPPLFALALEGKAFLGYSPDAEDAVSARDGRNILNELDMRDQMAQRQRLARQLGLTVNTSKHLGH